MARKNAIEMIQKFSNKRDVGEILKDEDIRFKFQPTGLGEEDMLKFQYDIDGVVIEVDQLCHIRIPVHYMSIKNPPQLFPVYHYLKKHLNLRQYNQKKLKLLKEACGMHLSYAQVSGLL